MRARARARAQEHGRVSGGEARAGKDEPRAGRRRWWDAEGVGATRARTWKTVITAWLISGPMPSPGKSVARNGAGPVAAAALANPRCRVETEGRSE